MLTLETKLAHPTEDPVVEVTEKVELTENQKINDIPNTGLKCLNVISLN